MAHDVFISHSAKDKAVADAVCATLEAAGIRCWIAPRDITPGTTWAAAIHEGIRRSRAFVFLFSVESNSSKQVLREIDQAVKGEIPIFPFRLDRTVASPELDYYASSAHWLDASTPPMEAHIGRLRDTLRSVLSPTNSVTSAMTAAPVPVAVSASKRLPWPLWMISVTSFLYGVPFCYIFILEVSDYEPNVTTSASWQLTGLLILLLAMSHLTAGVGIPMRHRVLGRGVGILAAAGSISLGVIMFLVLTSEGWRGSPSGVALAIATFFVYPVVTMVLLASVFKTVFTR